jgi:hypothetical protein
MRQKDEQNAKGIAKKRTNIRCFARGSAFFERWALYH